MYIKLPLIVLPLKTWNYSSSMLLIDWPIIRLFSRSFKTFYRLH